MSATKRLLSLAAGIAAVLTIAAAVRPESDHENAEEIARLRAHFDTVLRELRDADVGHLDEAQVAARATMIARLEQYAAAGRFPHNHVRPGERVPVFRDEHGTLCAMGFLIASTGRGDIVEHVTSTDNLIYIRDLAGNAPLRAWLDSAGLTLAEAGRIQPAYEGGPCFCVPSPDPAAAARARRDYAIASAAGTALTGASLFINLSNVAASRPNKTGIWLGLVAGGAQAVYGGMAVSQTDWRRDVGIANIAIGGMSAAAASWRLRHSRRSAETTADVAVQPYATVNGAIGLSLSARM